MYFILISLKPVMFNHVDFKEYSQLGYTIALFT